MLPLRSSGVVGERSAQQWSLTVRLGGARRSENVGTSSEIKVKNLDADLSEVSWVTVFVPGLVGPKPRPQGVGDGQQVNIPVLLDIRPRQANW